MKLSDYKNVKQLKRLSAGSLARLAADIRSFLLKTISVTGGHLASNLGVVELTLALHTVFDSPKDKFIWDVGHQSYVHKILTGRKDLFGTLRQFGGLSGFPKLSESPHDAFNTGHSSTAISAALGLASARDSKKSKGKIVAIVGDGSLTGGLALEGLNNAGRMNTDILVVLNDNEMSISKNVGAISNYLSEIRTTSKYLGAKEGVHAILDNLPIIGKPITKGIKRVKGMLKYAALPGFVFEELGFKYIGPVSGHDIRALLTVMRQVKNIKGPVLLHVITKKGKGFPAAERMPRNFHGTGPFCLKTGKPKTAKQADTYTDVFGDHIVELAKSNKEIVAVTAAMPDGTGLDSFKARYPDRFYDAGIAESHAVTFAAGLAMGGKRPVVAVYSSFLQRAYDQILHDVAIQKLPVVFAIDRAGVVDGDGETHQGLYDFAYMSHIPGMTIMAPSCKEELRGMLDLAFTLKGPVAIRYPKDRAYDNPCGNEKVRFGKSYCLQKGEKNAIVSVGTMLDVSSEVVKFLEDAGQRPSLYNARFVKPIDKALIEGLFGYSYVFTIEDHTITGGFGTGLMSEVMRYLAENTSKSSPLIYPFAMPDNFVETGTRRELFGKYGLTASNIAQKIQKIIKEK